MTGPPIAINNATAPPSPLRDILREALALGAAFRLSGAAVQIENFTLLPQSLQHALRPQASYIWSLNNVAWTKDTPPLPIAKGERVELLFVNQTPMPHPMHLHGHEFQVVEINDERFSGAVRDTVLVPPRHRVVVAFDANNPGLWALHCHLLYHLDAGMFTTLRYV